MDDLDDYDLATEIIEDEIATYVRSGIETCLAGLGDYGDEPAQRKILDQIQHLHLAQPWLPAVAAVRRLRESGLIDSKPDD
jgi:hypothetical protein